MGVWGTICHDQWDILDATVVCRMLGFQGALKAPGSAYFGKGTGDIFLDEVQCAGTESRLTDCKHKGIGEHNCGHIEDASVVCDDKGKLYRLEVLTCCIQLIFFINSFFNLFIYLSFPIKNQ